MDSSTPIPPKSQLLVRSATTSGSAFATHITTTLVCHHIAQKGLLASSFFFFFFKARPLFSSQPRPPAFPGCPPTPRQICQCRSSPPLLGSPKFQRRTPTLAYTRHGPNPTTPSPLQSDSAATDGNRSPRRQLNHPHAKSWTDTWEAHRFPSCDAHRDGHPAPSAHSNAPHPPPFL